MNMYHVVQRGRSIVVIILLFSLMLPLVVSARVGGDVLAKIDASTLTQTDSQGKVSAWLILRQQADLRMATTIKDWEARGRYVVERLQAVANNEQAGIRALMQSRQATYRPYWIINAVQVSVDQTELKALAARPEVARVVADETYRIPEPIPGKEEVRLRAVEWNIERIGAPQVWSTFGIQGDDIVVATIDSGVQFDHPALVAQYRGRQPDGGFNHNYNWFDPSNVCGNPSMTPCDNYGHGTHTMGTIVGDDGEAGANQIGVAPRARWIAAKGCEYGSCSLSALLAAGQWMLAPTDLDGQNPRVDLRPHIVNNSWGSDFGSDTFYQPMVQAWVAAGIFPVFANGNNGAGCTSVGAPASYVQSYGVGAFDSSDTVADFSSRGASPLDGSTKPNVAAPGVNIRSSVPGNGYASFSGTSMAAPHVAATVALLWSAAPALVGDIAATRAILDQTAVDVSDLSCGGTDINNNVWGEGRLDAFAAVGRAPIGPTGTLRGTVTDSANIPIDGATLQVVGPVDRTITTNASGQYSLRLPIGTYAITAQAFGLLPRTINGVVVRDGATTVRNIVLAPAPAHAVSGVVRNNRGEPISNAVVTILGTPIPSATTNASGVYSFARVPDGEYDVQAEVSGCNQRERQHLVIQADVMLDFVLAQRSDGHGYYCEIVSSSFIEATTVLPLNGDEGSAEIRLPFPFIFYGQNYTTAYVSTNGFLNFLSPDGSYWNSPLPSTSPPNAAIYPFWDDLIVDDAASVRTELIGTAPNRQFVVEWRNVILCCDPDGPRVRFEVVLFETGRILMQYADIGDDGRAQGNSATVGIENEAGTVALEYSNDLPSLTTGLAVLYRVLPSGILQGRVIDANDRAAIAGASVRAVQNGRVIRTATTDEAGFYRMQLPLGTYTVRAAAANYAFAWAQIVFDQEDEVIERGFALRTARAQVNPASLELIVPPGQRRSRTLSLANTGSQDLVWEIAENGGGRVNTTSSFGLARNPDYDTTARTAKGLSLGKAAPGWAPTQAGNVIRSWSTTALDFAWGVGYTGKVWLSDIQVGSELCAYRCTNHEFSEFGAPTGRKWDAAWARDWHADMAYDTTHNMMCQVNVGGDNGIHCWDPETGLERDSITGSFPWTSISQRGLAYRPNDDTFYIGGWNTGILYHIKGLSHPDKGAVIGQCSPPDGAISGLAWNPAFNVIWAATNSPTDTIYELNPDTCAVLGTLAHPDPYHNGAGLEMDDEGNLWMLSQGRHMAYLVDSGVPSFVDVPWLSTTPGSGTLVVGGSQNVVVTVNTTGLQPGVYTASLVIRSNSGRQTSQRVPISLIVPAYQQGANTGGGPYTDRAGNAWAADRRYAAGRWGYLDRSSTVTTTRAIAGTSDDVLYQSARLGQVEYRFDGLSVGIYQVEIRSAEIQNRRRGERLYDVIVERRLVLPAHDIVAEVGTFAADPHSVYVSVTDGQLNIRFVPRQGFSQPIINAIRVTQRPDR